LQVHIINHPEDTISNPVHTQQQPFKNIKKDNGKYRKGQ